MQKFFILLSFLLMGSLAWAVRPGDRVPDWEMKDLDGTSHRLEDFRGKIVVLEWTNYDCPFVQKHYASGNLQKLQKQWSEKGVVWFSVRTGNTDSRELANMAKTLKVQSKAVLLDATGKTAEAYRARTTPHIFIINPKGKLAYCGAVDDQPTPDPATLKGARNYVSEALEAMLAGKPINVSATRPYGCGVK
jgi:peroxiredoxin